MFKLRTWLRKSNKNTFLIKGNFVCCYWKGSEFDYFDISGLNLDGA